MRSTAGSPSADRFRGRTGALAGAARGRQPGRRRPARGQRELRWSVFKAGSAALDPLYRRSRGALEERDGAIERRARSSAERCRCAGSGGKTARLRSGGRRGRSSTLDGERVAVRAQLPPGQDAELALGSCSGGHSRADQIAVIRSRSSEGDARRVCCGGARRRRGSVTSTPLLVRIAEAGTRPCRRGGPRAGGSRSRPHPVRLPDALLARSAVSTHRGLTPGLFTEAGELIDVPRIRPPQTRSTSSWGSRDGRPDALHEHVLMVSGRCLRDRQKALAAGFPSLQPIAPELAVRLASESNDASAPAADAFNVYAGAERVRPRR